MSNGDAVLEQELTPPHVGPPLEGRLAASPYNFLFTPANFLRVTVHNSQTGVVVAIHYRIQVRGEIIASVQTMAPASDRSPDSDEFSLGEGYLLNVTVFASSGAPRRGQTFVRVQAIHGRGGSATVLGTLVQGYVTGNQDRAWPGSPLEGSLDGDGYTRTFQGTTPAAGNPVSESVPTGARWRVRAAQARLITSGVAGARMPFASLDPQTVTLIGVSWQPAGQSSGADRRYFWNLGMPLETILGPYHYCAGLPDMVIVPPAVFQIKADGMLGGDQFDSPSFIVDEWLEAQ